MIREVSIYFGYPDSSSSGMKTQVYSKCFTSQLGVTSMCAGIIFIFLWDFLTKYFFHYLKTFARHEKSLKYI